MLDFIKVITACFPKGIIKKMRRQTTERKKIFQIYESKEDLYPEYM